MTQPPSKLAALLSLRGTLPSGVVAWAVQRERIYGGGLDTILLETGKIDEATLAAHIGLAVGLPAADLAAMEDTNDEAPAGFGLGAAERCGAVPVARGTGKDAGVIHFVGRAGVDMDAVADWAARQGLSAGIAVTTEVRFRGLVSRVYGTPPAPRFLVLLGKLMGAVAAKRWVRAPDPVPVPVPVALIEAARVEVQQIEIARETGTRATLREAAAIIDIMEEANSTQLSIADNQDADLLLEIYELAPDSAAGRTAGGKVVARLPCDVLLDRFPVRLSRRPEAERALLRLLALYDGKAAARVIVPRLGDEDVQWRRWAAGALEFVDVSGTETTLCRLIEESDEGVRRAALRALRRRLAHPTVAAFTENLRVDVISKERVRAQRAIAALGELRDPGAVPLLTGMLKNGQGRVPAFAHAALVDITKQNFGNARWRWASWWRQARDRHRVEWLLEALAHKRPEMRLAASVELRELTGEYFGYHFDLSKRDREESVRRWRGWWETVGQDRFEGGSGGGGSGDAGGDGGCDVEMDAGAGTL